MFGKVFVLLCLFPKLFTRCNFFAWTHLRYTFGVPELTRLSCSGAPQRLEINHACHPIFCPCFLALLAQVTMARKKQDSLKAIATQVVKPKESQATPAKKRVGRQDVKTPVRKDVTLRAEELTHGGRLTEAAFAQLKKDFPTQDLKKNFITKQLKMYREEKAEGRPVSWNDRLVTQEKTLRTWSYQVYACCCEEVDRHQQSKLGSIVVQALGWKASWWRNKRVACDRQNMVQGARNASQKTIHQTEAYPTPQNKSAVLRSIPDRHQISSVHWLEQRRSRWWEVFFLWWRMARSAASFVTRMVTISFLLRHAYSTNQECLKSWCWPFALGLGRSTDLTVKWVSGASP